MHKISTKSFVFQLNFANKSFSQFSTFTNSKSPQKIPYFYFYIEQLNCTLCLIQFAFFPGVMFNYLTERLPNWMKQSVLGAVLGVVVYSFKLFNPLAYGFSDASTEANSTMHGLRWVESWEF
jgi:dolichyl-phosphate-mannose--protein O-mannosyl transferase